MLTHRLDIMDTYVERFVIVESIYDYRGNPKEICCTPSFLESLKYKNKITHIIVKDIPLEKELDNEFHVWDAISRGLDLLQRKDAHETDIVLISNVNELCDTEFLLSTRTGIIETNKLYWIEMKDLNMEFKWYMGRLFTWNYYLDNGRPKISDIRFNGCPPILNRTFPQQKMTKVPHAGYLLPLKVENPSNFYFRIFFR